ncbi:MAG: fused MFS/spermidine synthase [Verrucomicrobiales bacterium]
MKRKRPAQQPPQSPRVAGSEPPDSSEMKVGADPKEKGVQGLTVWAMVGLSGFACLVYQILWMRQLGLLFGNTSHATAITLAAFFGGLALGSWWWGRRCGQITRPLRVYARLEFGIAACGLILLLAPLAIAYFYPMLYGKAGQGIGLFVFKIVWTIILIFPSAILMGGTLPIAGQAVIRRASSFGTTSARLYAMNTIGAACGAFATAFVLIWLLGLRLTCVVAMLASAFAGVLALMLSRKGADNQAAFVVPAVAKDESSRPRGSKDDSQAPAISRRVIRALAFVSGFSLLALEVIWTRMIAQVHENSVYGFSTVLIVVLAGLALGAWLASWLARGSWSEQISLVLVLMLGGSVLAFTPFVFTRLTENLSMLPTDTSFAIYVARLFGTGFLAIGPACVLLGAVFPFLMKCEERFTIQPGASIGSLSATNTLGSILGSLAAGFLLLEWLGLWRSIQCVAAVYLVAAVLIPSAKSDVLKGLRAMAVVMLVFSFAILRPGKLPSSWTKDANGNRETLLEKWESSDCTVTVVRDVQGDVAIKINSNYSLGSIGAFSSQMYQARIPLLAFPATDSVFFLGMGTGITAGEALDRDGYPNVNQVVACELSPGVIEAARKYFAGGTGMPDLTNGLFHDPRASVLTKDGRNHLMATSESYSMINADLFLPYRRGTGNLYSREHFQRARERLKPGGVFVQWLPLYQITEREFGIIARTMTAVFPQVSLWRGNFQPGAEIAALVGHSDGNPLPASMFDSDAEKRAAVEGATYRDIQNLRFPINEQTVLFFYAGNIGLAADLFGEYPLNTDDRPVVEFGTPRSLHRPANEGKPQFLQKRFADLVDRVQAKTPPHKDPLLVARTPSSRELSLAGSAFHRASIAAVTGDEEKWRREWDNFLFHWNYQANPFDEQ